MKTKISALLAALMFLASGPASAGGPKLRLYRLKLDYAANGDIWHLSAKVCNKGSSTSGPLLFKLRLYDLPVKWGVANKEIGHVDGPQLEAGRCIDQDEIPIKVNTKKVNPATYHIAVAIGEVQGSAFKGSILNSFDRDYVKKTPYGKP
jgi:hypothetical protein